MIMIFIMETHVVNHRNGNNYITQRTAPIPNLIMKCFKSHFMNVIAENAYS